ncbi:MAG TPA: hypothetical protein VGG92_02400 [Caulobacteraceae bacterium]
MRSFILGVATTAALLSTSVAVGAASAEPSSQLIFGVDRASDAPSLERVQFIFGGRNFCWYDNAWQGPGFYWCGYANRRGQGWGGGDGFNGWHGGHGAGGHGNRYDGHGAVGDGDRSGGHATREGGDHADGARFAVSHDAARGGHGGTDHAAGARQGVAHAGGHADAHHGNHGGGDRKPGE